MRQSKVYLLKAREESTLTRRGDGSALDDPAAVAPRTHASTNSHNVKTHVVVNAVASGATGLVAPSATTSRLDWPPLPEAEAFHGLAGDVVKVIEPHSEADPVALLAQFILAFGNVVGTGPHFMAESDRHPLNLFAMLVGETAKGRKGTSWGHIRRLFEIVCPDWATQRIQTGLSSGEGLIDAVRDGIDKTAVSQIGRARGRQQLVDDHGVDDKRLLVMEPEFAATLRVLRREGNTLSPIIRTAWDGGRLQVLAKNSPARASGAHISIVGHVTRSELLRCLSDVETGNGFANRFLWFCVQRSKTLPEGGHIEEVELASIQQRLKDAVNFAAGVTEIKRDVVAREMWADIYPTLSAGMPGLLGAVTARAEAQVMRLACLYALLDHSSEIHDLHLNAALPLRRYCSVGRPLVEASSRRAKPLLKSSSSAMSIRLAFLWRPKRSRIAVRVRLVGHTRCSARSILSAS